MQKRKGFEFTQHCVSVDTHEYNETYTLVHSNASSPLDLYKTTPTHTLAHLGCVVQLLGRNHNLSHANREEDPGEMDIWTENREEGEMGAKGGKANGEKE